MSVPKCIFAREKKLSLRGDTNCYDDQNVRRGSLSIQTNSICEKSLNLSLFAAKKLS